MSHITCSELALWRKHGYAFELLDVRRARARLEQGVDIEGGQWHDPALWLDWKDSVASAHPVVVYCAHGHEISQGLVAALRVMGLDARHLEGGMTAWREQGHPVNEVPFG